MLKLKQLTQSQLAPDGGDVWQNPHLHQQGGVTPPPTPGHENIACRGFLSPAHTP